MDANCSICNDRFRHPKVLPCLHCYCRDCIDALRVKGRKTFHCPECGTQGKDACLPENGAEDLPDAYPVNHQLELCRFVESLASGEVSVCDACARGAEPRTVQAVGFCKKCGEHICQACLSKHRTEFQLSDHKVLSYAELSESGDLSQHRDILTQSRSIVFDRFSRCSVHQYEKLTRYCYDCGELICIACAQANHEGHKFDFTNVSAEKRKSDLREQLPNIRHLRTQLLDSVDGIQKSRSGIDDQKQSLSTFIDNEFDRLYKILERHKTKLQSSLTNLADRKLERLAEQQQAIENASAELIRLEKFMEDTVESTTQTELLLFYKFLEERISDSTGRSRKVSMAPVETPNLAVKSSCGSYISAFFHKHMAVYCTQADPSKCTAEGPGLKTPEVFQVTQFAVHVFNKNREQCSFPQDLSAEIRCLRTDATVNGEVHDSGKGYYNISYCPADRGEHSIRVLVNDNHIRGSPFSVNVHQPPSLLGKSEGMIEELKAPRGIAITQDSHLLVTEWNDGRIVEYDQQGKRIRCFGTSGDRMDQKLRHPAGIVTDEEGSVYVVDAAGEQCCVVKYDNTGLQVAKVGRKGSGTSEFVNPRGVALNPVSGKIYVCDRDNHRLQIFSSDLDFVSCLDIGEANKSLSQPSKPNDVTFDDVGNLYITDYANNCLLCFDANHQYLKSLSKQGTEPGCLSGPESVHIDRRGYLYVTESKNHRVSVFDSSRGSLVSHFGRLGSGEGELKFPMGVVTDANGYVYVCELFNNRIQLF